MKKIYCLFLYSIVLVLAASCKDDDPAPVSTPGVIEKFITDNPSIKVSEIKDSYVSPFKTDFGVYRGYFIIPSKNIKVKALGCKASEKGAYELILSSGALYDFANGDYIYRDNIDIQNEGVFQFKDVHQEIVLSANRRYLLVYFRKNQSSYFEARYVFPQGSDDADHIKIPLMIDDVEVVETFYAYANYGSDGNSYSDTGGGLMSGAFDLEGLVDFRYEVAE